MLHTNQRNILVPHVEGYTYPCADLQHYTSCLTIPVIERNTNGRMTLTENGSTVRNQIATRVTAQKQTSTFT